MYFPDLGTETQIVVGDYVRAVGWLDVAQPYRKGRVDAMVVERLRSFAKNWGESVTALDWPVAAGMHTCNLCQRFRASGTFGVPSGQILFVCPEMLAHYVEVHMYLPPIEFREALVSAPEPGSEKYKDAVAPFRMEVPK